MSNDKFQNKYRIPSARARWHDYNGGAYFITICTKNKNHYFGEIENNEIQLSEIGKIVQSEWLKTIEIRPDMNLLLDEFIVMPNHFHGIIFIGDNQYNTDNVMDMYQCCGTHQCRDAMHCVSTEPNRPTEPTESTKPIPTTPPSKNKFAPQSKNLASIIRGFKIAVTTYARKNNIDFAWQERFYDRIIRDNTGLDNVRAYIFNNPRNWNNDKLNQKIWQEQT